MKVIDQLREAVTERRIFGEPFEKNGVTIIPAARVSGGGGGGGGGEDAGTEGSGGAGGGGFGVNAGPAGAFVIKGDHVRWVPAIDVNRIILGAQVVAIIALLSWRAVAKARARR